VPRMEGSDLPVLAISNRACWKRISGSITVLYIHPGWRTAGVLSVTGRIRASHYQAYRFPSGLKCSGSSSSSSFSSGICEAWRTVSVLP